MSCRGSRAAGCLFVVFVVSSAIALLDVARAAGRAEHPTGPRHWLAPMSGASHRTRETVIGESHFRRTCVDGRCALFARGPTTAGYPLFASYPANEWVRVDHGPVVQLSAAPPLRESPASPSTPWLAALSCTLLLALLGLRAGSLRLERERFEHARPAIALEDGGLLFVDAKSPERGASTTKLPAGPATALHRDEARHTLGDGPFREGEGNRWRAVPGARGDHLLAIENARGRNRTLAVVTLLLAIGALAGAIYVA